MIDIAAIKARFEALAPVLDERGRRLFAASEARAAGHGGVVAVSRATGIARSTIDRGLADLRSGAVMSSPRVRRPGGGGKPAIKTQPWLLAAVNALVEPSIRGDPEAALRWVSKSQRRLSAALAERGFTAGQKLVGRLLKRLGFSLQANAKTRESTSHPDRNAQFEHINAEVKAFQAAGEPVISVDTKKKELVGDFKNGGRELRPKGQPEPVRVHDFVIPELGKVAPYGVEGAGRQVRMTPGEFRTGEDQEVSVGRHLPPSAAVVKAFMAHFEARYRFGPLGPGSRIMAIAAAHHRLNYIHPFLDRNGRVSRLMSHAMALEAGIGAHGLWSVSRGLARGLESRGEYKRMMDHADSPRQGDLDGRGNLSRRAWPNSRPGFSRSALTRSAS